MIQKSLRDFIFLIVPFSFLLILFLIIHSFPFQLSNLNHWNFVTFSLKKYAFICGAYLGMMCFLYWSKSEDNKKKMLVGMSLFFVVLLYGKFTVLFYIAAYVFYRVLYSDFKNSTKLYVLIAMFELWAFILLEVFYNNAVLFWYSFVFTYMFFLRYFLFIHHNFSTGFKREKFIDFILYIFFPVYFVILPHMFILPQYGHFTRAIKVQRKIYLKTAKKGMKNVCMGFFCLLGLWIVTRIPNMYFFEEERNVFMYHVLSTRWILDYSEWVFRICAYGSILLGLVRGLGYDISSPFNKPFLSKNIVDLYNRLFIHLKEYYLIIFYMPIVIVLRRWPKYMRSFVSVLLSFLLGGLISILLTVGFPPCSSDFNSIEGISTVVGAFHEEVTLSDSDSMDIFLLKLRDIYPTQVGWLNLHVIAFIHMVLTLVLGILFGTQLVYNQWVATKKKEKIWVNKYFINPISVIVQFILMMGFIYIFF